MSRPTRRGILTATAAALTATAVSPGPALAARPRALPLVTSPGHPGAQYPPGASAASGAEPLNATVGCALPRRGEG